MSEDTTTPEAPAAEDDSTEPAQDVASLPEWAQTLIRTTRAEAAQHRTRVRELEPLQKKASEAEQRAAAAEKRATESGAEALRFRIANEYELSQADAMTLQHIPSEEGMRTVAERLRAATEGQRRPAPPVTSLASGSVPASKSGETGRAAAALRQLRQG